MAQILLIINARITHFMNFGINSDMLIFFLMISFSHCVFKILADAEATFTPSPGPMYAIKDIGPMQAYDLNQRGYAVGGFSELWIWRNHQLTQYSLGPSFGGQPAAINDNGAIVGCMNTGQIWVDPFFGDGAGIQHAFLWTNGSITDLGTLGGVFSWAGDINDLNQIIGNSSINQLEGMKGYPFLWEKGEMKLIQSLFPAESKSTVLSAVHIDNSGNIYGVCEFNSHQYVYQLSTRNDFPINLKMLGDVNKASVSCFNDRKQGAGTLSSGPNIEAVLWKTNGTIELGVPKGSYALSINNLAQVVGEYDSSSYHAFIWQQGVWYDLNNQLIDADGWILVNANAINDAGQIVGHGMHKGVHRAFLLTPLPILSRMALKSSGKKLELEITSIPGEPLLLEISSDLASWWTFTNSNMPSNKWTVIDDYYVGGFSNKYYRVKIIIP